MGPLSSGRLPKSFGAIPVRSEHSAQRKRGWHALQHSLETPGKIGYSSQTIHDASKRKATSRHRGRFKSGLASARNRETEQLQSAFGVCFGWQKWLKKNQAIMKKKRIRLKCVNCGAAWKPSNIGSNGWHADACCDCNPLSQVDFWTRKELVEYAKS